MHLLLKLSLYLSLKVIASTPVHQTVQSQLLVASPTVLCNLEYATSYYTDYKEVETEECHTEYEKICVTETNVVCVDSSVTKCDLVHDTKCHTEYTQQCADKFKVEVEPYIETVCATLYKEECEHRWEGEGNEKVWVPIPGTCKQEPYEECTDVAKTKERQVAYPVCQDIPHQVCVDVPKEVCHEIPEKKCAQKPYEVCHDKPIETCIKVHKKIPVKASKKIPKQRCVHTDGYQEPGKQLVPTVPYDPALAPGPVAPGVVVPPPAQVPQFVAVPANPAAPSVPLPQFTNVFRLGKNADLGDEEDYQDIDQITTEANNDETDVV